MTSQIVADHSIDALAFLFLPHLEDLTNSQLLAGYMGLCVTIVGVAAFAWIRWDLSERRQIRQWEAEQRQHQAREKARQEIHAKCSPHAKRDQGAA